MAMAEETNGTVAVTDEDESKPAKTTVRAADLDPNERVSLMFGMPAGLKAMIEAKAEEQDVTTAAFVRDLVAKEFDYTLPTITRGGRAKKYATDEEKEAARKETSKGRRDVIRALLERYNNGEIELPDEVDALAAKVGLKKEPKEEAATA